jgi:hypothetical protein
MSPLAPDTYVLQAPRRYASTVELGKTMSPVFLRALGVRLRVAQAVWGSAGKMYHAEFCRARAEECEKLARARR